ncbi:MAG: hypothetical protein KF819_02615 [Labilithrix sp.]|nr:hypothetical protein [Labilithrix sp.]
MKISPRRVVQILAPLVAILTLMIGLRVGAGDAVRAAVVFGAPPGRAAPGAKGRLAWQLLTFIDDRGVKETTAMKGLVVVARARGQEARWTGESNGDGIAEITLEIEGITAGDPIDLEVRVEGDAEPLARGRAIWREVAWAKRDAARDGVVAALRPTQRTGAIGLDVVVENERLIPGFTTPLWIHATPPPGIAKAGIAIAIAPEPGLVAEREQATTCGDGWAEVPVMAQAHVVGSGFDARAAHATGRWFGSIPVAPGAFFVSMPRVIPEGTPSAAVLLAPNPRDVVYAELDDEQGRVAAAALKVVVEPGDPTPRARFELPPLAAGVHWLVVSGEPRGGERLAGAATAKAILVGGAPGIDLHDTCSVGPWLAQRPATGFPRWVALDGLPERSAHNRTRYRLGMFIGLVALLAAGILETLILVAASREARVALQLAELDEDDASAKKVTAAPPGGSLAIALLVAILGFALLAVLLVAKG